MSFRRNERGIFSVGAIPAILLAIYLHLSTYAENKPVNSYQPNPEPSADLNIGHEDFNRALPPELTVFLSAEKSGASERAARVATGAVAVRDSGNLEGDSSNGGFSTSIKDLITLFTLSNNELLQQSGGIPLNDNIFAIMINRSTNDQQHSGILIVDTTKITGVETANQAAAFIDFGERVSADGIMAYDSASDALTITSLNGNIVIKGLLSDAPSLFTQETDHFQTATHVITSNGYSLIVTTDGKLIQLDTSDDNFKSSTFELQLNGSPAKVLSAYNSQDKNYIVVNTADGAYPTFGLYEIVIDDQGITLNPVAELDGPMGIDASQFPDFFKIYGKMTDLNNNLRGYFDESSNDLWLFDKKTKNVNRVQVPLPTNANFSNDEVLRSASSSMFNFARVSSVPNYSEWLSIYPKGAKYPVLFNFVTQELIQPTSTLSTDVGFVMFVFNVGGEQVQITAGQNGSIGGVMQILNNFVIPSPQPSPTETPQPTVTATVTPQPTATATPTDTPTSQVPPGKTLVPPATPATATQTPTATSTNTPEQPTPTPTPEPGIYPYNIYLPAIQAAIETGDFTLAMQLIKEMNEKIAQSKQSYIA